MTNAEAIVTQLNDILNQIADIRAQMEQEHKKLQMALSATFRLFEGKGTTLAGLHGTPDDLKGYLTKMSVELSQKTTNALDTLKVQLSNVLSGAQAAYGKKL